MPVTMTREERDLFLGGVHVGVLSVAAVDGCGPLAVPVFRMTPERWLSVDYSKVYG
jgi:hypothetical protein